MKLFSKNQSPSRRGAGVLLAMGLLGFGIVLLVVNYVNKAWDYYGSVRSMVDGYRGKELAYAGLQAGLISIRSIPEEYLFKLGIVSNPPRIQLAENCNDSGLCTKYYASYSIQPEDGKLNINVLVRSDDEINANFKNIFTRLFEELRIDVDTLDSIIDWIDSNDFLNPNGAESNHYESLEPSRKIKNSVMYSLSELAAVKDFNRNLIYEAHVPTSYLEEQENRASRSELEESLLQEDDWVLANNITAYVPRELLGSEKVSVNAARAHVLLSLSPQMTAADVLALFSLRSKKEGYIKNKKDIENIPELTRQGVTGASISKQLLGTGKVGGFLKLTSRFYRVTGIGFISIASDIDEKPQVVSRVWGIWDKQNQELLYYSED